MQHDQHMAGSFLTVETPQTIAWWGRGMIWMGIFISLLIGVASARATTPQILMPATEPAAAPIHPRVVESAGHIAPIPTPLATIFHSLEERQHVAAGDRVVIDAGADKNLQPGMQLTVIRPLTEVTQPATNQLLGTTLVPVGTAVVEQVQPTTAVLRILYVFDAIQPGDLVTPFAAPPSVPTNASYAAQGRTIKGLIVATKDDKVAVGPGDIVYLDQGKQHGVGLGDRFNILQESQTVEHPAWHHAVQLPPQSLGSLEIIDVRDQTSTALITSGQREFAVGDPVELRPPVNGEQATSPSAAQAAAYRQQLFPCLEAAYQAIRDAEAAGVTPLELAAAHQALQHAEAVLERAETLLEQGYAEQAMAQLRLLETDCLTAQELSTEARLLAGGRRPAQPDQYRVVRGDTLWSIAGKPTIYRNSLMWPIIYKANQQQIPDPDRIFPQQLLAIPRYLSPEEIALAIQRARTRGPWRQGDGRDVYILEGIKR
jgi:nucleoid-associated protein YgaU